MGLWALRKYPFHLHVSMWTAYCKASQRQIPTRKDLALLHRAQPLGWVFGGSVSRDFCASALENDMWGWHGQEHLLRGEGTWVSKFHGPGGVIKLYCLQIISSIKSRLVNISKIHCHSLSESASEQCLCIWKQFLVPSFSLFKHSSTCLVNTWKS